MHCLALTLSTLLSSQVSGASRVFNLVVFDLGQLDQLYLLGSSVSNLEIFAVELLLASAEACRWKATWEKLPKLTDLVKSDQAHFWVNLPLSGPSDKGF